MEQQLKKLLREHEPLVMALIILVLSGVGLLFGVVPLLQKTLDMYGQLGILTEETQMLQQKVSVLNGLDEDTLRTNIQTLSTAVPSDKSLATLFGTLDGLTSRWGVSIGSLTLSRLGSVATGSAIKLTSDEQAVGSNILSFTLSVGGTYDQIHAFINAAVSVRRFFRIRSFDITVTSPAKAVASLAMDTFYLPLPSSLGSIRQPVATLSEQDNQLISQVSAIPLAAQSVANAPAPSVGAGKSDPFSL